jgi:hypothetical protein
MKKILLLLTMATALGACNKAIPDQTDTREMFNAGGLQVITSFANTQQKIMAVVYGNEAAKKSAVSEYQVHTSGEVFQLVVYKQADNKYWYGSHINGRVQSVETIIYQPSAGAGEWSYKLEQGGIAGNKVSAADRISYIFAHKPSVFP